MARRKLPRALSSALASTVLDPSEIVYDQDQKIATLGDGITPGGRPLADALDLADPDLGALLVGFRQAGTGAVGRGVLDKLRETVSVKDFGAIGDGVTRTVAQWIIPGALGRYASLAALQADYPHVTAATDNLEWAAFQAGINHLMSAGGGSLFVPDGIYNIAATVTQDRSVNASLGVVDIIGAGRKAVTIYHSGPTKIFSVIGNATVPEGITKDIKIAGMTLIGSGATGEHAIDFSLVSFPHFADLEFGGFDLCYNLQDVDHAVFHACVMRFNRRGLFARQNPAPTPGSNSTLPNQFTFVECTFSSNSAYAFHDLGGSNWTFIGCSVENNGFADANGFGAKFEDCGYQGGAICSFNGTYFESNNGIADVILIQTTPSTLVAATYNFNGTIFNRASTANKSVNSIQTNFASVANVGLQILNLNGCTFKSFNAYLPSGATPYLGYLGAQQRTHANFNAPGTVFKDAAEAPTQVQRIGKPFSQFGKDANQTIPNASPTIWAINTNNLSFSSVGAINGSSQIVIAEAGNYALSTNLVFTGVLAGTGSVEIRKNGFVVSKMTPSSADIYSTSTTTYLVEGDLIDVRVTQTSGGSAILASSAIANSYLNIQRLADG